MRFALVVLASLVSQSLAASVARGWGGQGHGHDHVCIDDADASLIATKFGMTISNFTTALADQLFSTNYTDVSDSVETLLGALDPSKAIPLGSVTFSSKAAFIAGSSAQGPEPFEVLNVWHNCGTVIIRWRSLQTPNEVTGILVQLVEPAQPGQGGGFGTGSQKWQIYQTYSEFNSGAWLKNLGSPECKTS